MKQKISFVIVFLLMSLFFVSWCEKKIVDSIGEVYTIDSNILSQPIKVTDPEVLKELQFMRDELDITPENYEKLIRMDNIPLKWWSELDQQHYPLCPEPECDALTSRLSIQNDMKEIYSESNVVKDPNIIAELRFMKKRGMIDYGFYKHLLREGAFIKIQSGDIVVEGYPWCYYGSGCDKIISRESIQNEMKNL